MKEQVDIVLRYAIFIYGAFCVYGYLSDVNFVYSKLAKDYLIKENFNPDRVIKVGSPMKEVLDAYSKKINKSKILDKMGLIKQKYFVLSCHREENIDLNFNHPVKEIVWAGVRSTAAADSPDLFAKKKIYSSSLSDTVKLTLNGQDRFAPRDIKYFTRTQIWQHHTGYGSTQSNGDEIAVYSFALKPEEHQPSGSCNFSRIDNFSISFTGDQSYDGYKIYLYAKNYNVLRIMEGMGGLLYAN